MFISEYIKQGILLILIIIISLFGVKGCRKHQKKKQIVIELSAHAGESAAYEQFYKETAHENLLKAMYQMHLASDLDLTSNEILDQVMRIEKELFASKEETSLPLRKQMIRDSLLSNFDNCKKLGLFSDAANITALSKGNMPTISKGPASGDEAVILPIISNTILPGADKLMPNMIISPPTTEGANSKESQLQRARAILLLKSLAGADLIGHNDYQKVLDHYEKEESKQ